MGQASTLSRIVEHHHVVLSLGYNAFGTFLQGSQNYGFEYEGSDVDSKSLVIPSFSDLCLSKLKRLLAKKKRREMRKGLSAKENAINYRRHGEHFQIVF